MRVTLEIDGEPFDVTLEKADGGYTVEVDGDVFAVRVERNGTGGVVRVGKRSFHVHHGDGLARIDGEPVAWRITALSGGTGVGLADAARAARVRPPMIGRIDRLLVEVGQTVKKGDILFVLEAMKMQNEVRSPVAGRVSAIHAAAGAAVAPNQVILELEPV